jgi:glycerol-3-phosphate O-acyltransferase
VNSPKSAHSILEEVAQIQRMERGKLTVMREGPSGPFYKLQAREEGKNVTRYVPRAQAAAVQEAIEGYQRFEALTQEYAQQIIAKTRQEIAAGAKKKKPARNSSSPKARKCNA